MIEPDTFTVLAALAGGVAVASVLVMMALALTVEIGGVSRDEIYVPFRAARVVSMPAILLMAALYFASVMVGGR